MKLVDMSWAEILAQIRRDRGKGVQAADSTDLWAEAERRLQILAKVVLGRLDGISAADREDLVQEMLLKMQSSELLTRAEAAVNADAYVRAMLRNAGYDLARRLSSEATAVARLQSGAETAAKPASLERSEARARLLSELRRLEPQDQRLIQRRYWDGMSIKAIADEMGVRYSTAAVRLFRLTRRLAAHMQE